MYTHPHLLPAPLRDPSLVIESAAVREGCIIVTLDVLQLAGMTGLSKSTDAPNHLSRQLHQQQQEVASASAETPDDPDASPSRYR